MVGPNWWAKNWLTIVNTFSWSKTMRIWDNNCKRRPCSFHSWSNSLSPTLTHFFSLSTSSHTLKKFHSFSLLPTLTNSFTLLHITIIFHILKIFIIYIIMCTNSLITIMKSFIYFLDVMEIFISCARNCKWRNFCYIYWINNNYFLLY